MRILEITLFVQVRTHFYIFQSNFVRFDRKDPVYFDKYTKNLYCRKDSIFKSVSVKSGYSYDKSGMCDEEMTQRLKGLDPPGCGA